MMNAESTAGSVSPSSVIKRDWSNATGSAGQRFAGFRSRICIRGIWFGDAPREALTAPDFEAPMSALAEREEHNPKLVYVLRKLWARFGHRSVYRVAAGCFTETPVIAPDPVQSPGN